MSQDLLRQLPLRQRLCFWPSVILAKFALGMLAMACRRDDALDVWEDAT